MPSFAPRKRSWSEKDEDLEEAESLLDEHSFSSVSSDDSFHISSRRRRFLGSRLLSVFLVVACLGVLSQSQGIVYALQQQQVALLGALSRTQSIAYALQQQQETEDAYVHPGWHRRELPDQLRLMDSAPLPKLPFDDFGSLPNPTLAAIKTHIEGLSMQDASILQSLIRAAPVMPDHVGDQCGDIVERQARNQLKTDGPKIVYYEWETVHGLADRFKGIISSFLVAYALDLPYYIHWDPKATLPAETVFESPYLNWLWPHAVVPGAANTSYFASFAGGGKPGQEAYWPMSSHEELLAYAAPADINYWAGNIGHAAGAFEHSKYFGSALAERGLSKESAYGCALNYLLQPIRATRLAMADYQAVLAHPAVFSVAVQARLGDKALLAGETASSLDLKPSMHYFRCAMSSVRQLMTPEHKLVVLYVASDNPAFRKMALELSAAPERLRAVLDWDEDLPTPLLLIGPAVPAHMAYNAEVQAEDRHRIQHNMQYSIFENWLMDAADARIITYESGFGTISALRTWMFGASTSTWQVRPPVGDQESEARLVDREWCKNRPSRLESLYWQWGFA